MTTVPSAALCLARHGQPALDQRHQPLGIGEGRLHRRHPPLVGVRTVPRPEHVDREGVVAELGQHVGPAHLVVADPVPVVDDDHEPARRLGCREVALERLAADLVADRTGQRRSRQRQAEPGRDEPLHAFLPCLRLPGDRRPAATRHGDHASLSDPVRAPAALPAITSPAATISAMPTSEARSRVSPQITQAQKLTETRKKYSKTARKLVSPDW